MQFPNPREAFASNEIGELKKQGADISVHSYRTKHRQIEKLIQERQLENIPLSFSTTRTIFGFLFFSVKHLLALAFLLKQIFKFHINEPVHLVKALLLVPRTLELYDQIKDSKPQIVHLYWSHYPSLLGMLVRKYIPTICLTMSLAAYDIRMKYKGSKYLTSYVDAVTTHCKKNIPVITKFGVKESQIHLLYRGIANKYFREEVPDKIPFSIISAGALIKTKGMHEVILAYEKIKAKFPLATLSILGEGKERLKLKQLVFSKNLEGIYFKGHVSHHELMEEMAKHEIFLFMSHEERIPNVAKEAIASHCYPVVSNTVGIEELVINGQTGSIIPIHGINEAADAVSFAFSEPSHLKKAREKGLKHLRHYFHLESEMQAYRNLWRSLLNPK